MVDEVEGHGSGFGGMLDEADAISNGFMANGLDAISEGVGDDFA